jgi:hypothetical protein
MIRIYNYMAMGVALTGVVSWLTFNAAVTETAGKLALTPFGQTLYSGPVTIVLFLGTLGLVFGISWMIEKLSPATALMLFMAYAALLGLMLSSIFLVYTNTSITRVFFISAAAFGALSLWGYTTKRDLSAMGTFLMMGLFGLIIAMLVNIFLKSRRPDLRGPHRLGHPEDQGDVRPDGRRHRRHGPQGRDGRADALSRLHQPLPVPAALHGRPPLIQPTGSSFRRPGRFAGAFFCARSQARDVRLWPAPSCF